MKTDLSLILPVLLVAAMPGVASAQTGVETLIGAVRAQPDGGAMVEVRLLNTGLAKLRAEAADSVDALLNRPGAFGPGRTVILHRDAATPPTLAIAPGRFATARYRLDPADVEDGALLSIPRWGDRSVRLALAPPSAPQAGTASLAQAQDAVAPAADAAPPTPSAADRTIGNAFVENLSAYQPIYAVYGPGTNSEARLQISFKYQLFGSKAREDRPALGDGFYFGYTQRMFWDLGANSSPFRNIDFQPEIFYVTPPRALSERVTLSAQVGARHESNGRAGLSSRSLNTVYVAPMGAFSLGEDSRLTVAPRAWFYAGDLSDNPDIRRYRGNTGLAIEIGQDDGLRLSTDGRINFGSGKGSFAADLSYPLRRLWSGGPDFYLFGQSFFGYGENLLDYNRRTTRVRIGVALVR